MPYKCMCGLFLVNHYCSGCNVLNECGIQTYCPGCEDHPMDPIPIKTDTMSDVLWLLWYVLLIVGVREKKMLSVKIIQWILFHVRSGNGYWR